MMAAVSPARATDNSRLRLAKASSSSRLTDIGPAGRGRDCRPPRLQGAKESLAGPQVRQVAGQPPGARLLVPAPLLAVGDFALGHGVAVDHADPHVAHRQAGLAVHARAGAAIGGHLDLVVAGHLHLAHGLFRADFGVDEAARTGEVAPADRTGPGVLDPL